MLCAFDDTCYMYNSRMVLLRFSSLAILLIKVYIDATCTPQDYCRVGTGSCAGVKVIQYHWHKNRIVQAVFQQLS